MSRHGLQKVTAVALVALSGAGCVSAQFQLRSYPAGAVLTEHQTGKQFRAPIDVTYVLTDKDRDPSGCYLIKGFTATWTSGAQVSSPPTIQLCGQGPFWNYRFDRPAGAPNANIDVAVENQIVQRQRENAELLGAALGGLARGMGGGNTQTYSSPPNTTTIGVTGPRNIGGASPTLTSPLPQIAPDGTFVSGGKQITLCPNGKYVAGNCHLAPDGSYVGD